MAKRKPAACPDCGAKLSPEAEACSNCPWSYREPEAENNPLKSQSKLLDLALPIAFFGLLGLSVWKLGVGLLKIGEESARPDKVSLSSVGAPLPEQDRGSAGAGEAGPGGAPGAQARGGRGSVLAASLDGADDEGSGSGTISVVKEAASPRAPLAPREWRFRGRVVDLVSLKPVAGARLTFTDDQAKPRAEATSGADGRYRTVLPPLKGRGYVVSIKKPGYAMSYAGPESAGARDLDAGSRRELARQLGRSVEAPAELEPASEAPLVTDFFLAPLDIR